MKNEKLTTSEINSLFEKTIINRTALEIEQLKEYNKSKNVFSAEFSNDVEHLINMMIMMAKNRNNDSYNNQELLGSVLKIYMNFIDSIFSGKIFTPLLGTDNEWEDITDNNNKSLEKTFSFNGKEINMVFDNIQRNKRMSTVFRFNDNNKYAYRTDYIQMIDIDTNQIFCCSDSVRFIEFPYNGNIITTKVKIGDRTEKTIEIKESYDISLEMIENGIVYPDQSKFSYNNPAYIIAPKVPFHMLKSFNVDLDERIKAFMNSYESVKNSINENSKEYKDEDYDELEEVKLINELSYPFYNKLKQDTDILCITDSDTGMPVGTYPINKSDNYNNDIKSSFKSFLNSIANNIENDNNLKEYKNSYITGYKNLINKTEENKIEKIGVVFVTKNDNPIIYENLNTTLDHFTINHENINPTINKIIIEEELDDNRIEIVNEYEKPIEYDNNIQDIQKWISLSIIPTMIEYYDDKLNYPVIKIEPEDLNNSNDIIFVIKNPKKIRRINLSSEIKEYLNVLEFDEAEDDDDMEYYDIDEDEDDDMEYYDIDENDYYEEDSENEEDYDDKEY